MQPQTTPQTPNSYVFSPVHPRVEIVPREALHHSPDGITAGRAHVGFADHPAQAPGHLDFGPLLLCAIGDVAPGTVAPQHPHKNAEIIDVVVGGEFAYADSLGNELTMRRGAASATSAGRGIEHGVEVLGDAPLRGVVIFVAPTHADATPRMRWDASALVDADSLRVIVSGRADAPADALPVGADVELSAARLPAGTSVRHRVAAGRGAYLFSTDGDFLVDGRLVRPGDRVLARDPGILEVETSQDLDLFLIDLPLA